MGKTHTTVAVDREQEEARLLSLLQLFSNFRCIRDPWRVAEPHGAQGSVFLTSSQVMLL